MASADGSYEKREYDNPYFELGVRDEDIYLVSVALSKKIWDGVGISLSYSRIRNDANVGDFDYDQNIYGISLTYDY